MADINCAICSDSLATVDQMTCICNCGHVYHEHCLTAWLTRSTTCPTCRVFQSKRHLRKIYLNVVPKAMLDVGTQACDFEPLIQRYAMHSNEHNESPPLFSEPSLVFRNASFTNEAARVRCQGLLRRLRVCEGTRSLLRREVGQLRRKVRFSTTKTDDLAAQVRMLQAQKRLLAGRLHSRKVELDLLIQRFNGESTGFSSNGRCIPRTSWSPPQFSVGRWENFGTPLEYCDLTSDTTPSPIPLLFSDTPSRKRTLSAAVMTLHQDLTPRPQKCVSLSSPQPGTSKNMECPEPSTMTPGTEPQRNTRSSSGIHGAINLTNSPRRLYHFGVVVDLTEIPDPTDLAPDVIYAS